MSDSAHTPLRQMRATSHAAERLGIQDSTGMQNRSAVHSCQKPYHQTFWLLGSGAKTGEVSALDWHTSRYVGDSAEPCGCRASDRHPCSHTSQSMAIPSHTGKTHKLCGPPAPGARATETPCSHSSPGMARPSHTGKTHKPPVHTPTQATPSQMRQGATENRAAHLRPRRASKIHLKTPPLLKGWQHPHQISLGTPPLLKGWRHHP